MQDLLDDAQIPASSSLTDAQLVGLIDHQKRLPKVFSSDLKEELTRRQLSANQIAALKESLTTVELVAAPVLFTPPLWWTLVVFVVGFAAVAHFTAFIVFVFNLSVAVVAIKRRLRIHPSEEQKTWRRVAYVLLLINVVLMLYLLL